MINSENIFFSLCSLSSLWILREKYWNNQRNQKYWFLFCLYCLTPLWKLKKNSKESVLLIIWFILKQRFFYLFIHTNLWMLVEKKSNIQNIKKKINAIWFFWFNYHYLTSSILIHTYILAQWRSLRVLHLFHFLPHSHCLLKQTKVFGWVHLLFWNEQKGHVVQWFRDWQCWDERKRWG